MEEKEKKSEEVKEANAENSTNTQEKEQEGKVENDPQFIAMSERVKELQEQIKALEQELYKKKGIRMIADKLNDLKNNLMEQAKMYGQKLQEDYKLDRKEKGNILKEFQAGLAQLSEFFEKKFNTISQERSDCQDLEQATYLKEHELKQKRKQIKKSPQYAEYKKQEELLVKQIKKALDEGKLDLVTEKNEQLKRLGNQNPLMKCDREIQRVQAQRIAIQQLINKCSKELENCAIQRYNAIQEVTQDKDNKLATRKKLNIFQKMAGAVMNKISGAKRFKDNVIGKLAEKVGFIKNKKVPEVEQNVGGQIGQFQEYMKKAKENILGTGAMTKEELMQRAKDRVSASQEPDRKTDQSTRGSEAGDMTLEMA